MKNASVTALASALAAYPCLTLWVERVYPLWYLEAAIFLCGMILWSFVFAWHTLYTRLPVFRWKVERKLWLAASLAATGLATIQLHWFDPTLRVLIPQDYPKNFDQWFASTLFILGFNQLFLV